MSVFTPLPVYLDTLIFYKKLRNQQRAKELIKNKLVQQHRHVYFVQTEYHKDINSCFYEMYKDIDYNLAISLRFGVIRIKLEDFQY
ncbi:hypothetical protein CUU64_18750 [Bacillus sp. V5-8f]|nr:hypothetical protein CUU64_18750 [Bacillus sp. V5-8f]